MGAATIGRSGQRAFEFSIEGSDAVHSIPLAAYLPYPFIRKMVDERSGESFAMALLHEFCPELDDDASLNLTMVGAIYKGWQAASSNDGISEGESRASSAR